MFFNLMVWHILPVLYMLGEDGPTVDVSGIITALAGTITPAQVATLMASIVGAGALIYLTWVFGRKAISAFYRAVRGKAPIA